ncbi:MAG: 2-C-methyl-D-erythritol 4-phosphate cytidylyltransferase [Deltaproteobacteria bacterium]|nr:2-C-methyl-D-erythritol 4-phosphate cytidylyltransferase [Candidatus Zymogenaceae bacterium]
MGGDRLWGVVPAAGLGERMRGGGGAAKQFLSIGGVPMLAVTLKALFHAADFAGVVLTLREDDFETAEDILAKYVRERSSVACVPGGAVRQESVYNGIRAVMERGGDPDDLVAIHDAARPVIHKDVVERAVTAARTSGAAVAVVPAVDAAVLTDGVRIDSYLDRKRLFRIQTPQVFRLGLIADAHEHARKRGVTDAVDDASLIIENGGEVRIVPGDPNNIKVTHPGDIAVVEGILAGNDGHTDE